MVLNAQSLDMLEVVLWFVTEVCTGTDGDGNEDGSAYSRLSSLLHKEEEEGLLGVLFDAQDDAC